MELMLMQMEKLPDLSGAYADVTDIPIIDFSTHHNNISHYQHASSPPPPLVNHLHPPSSISFSSAAALPPHEDPLPFLQQGSSSGGRWKLDDFLDEGGGVTPTQKRNSMAAMREMIFRIAAMQPIHIDPESVKPPKRRNVKISTDPQSVAARHRRERISERIRILQRLVPGGTKMDTASMLDEAIHYVKFLKNQVQSLERVAANRPAAAGIGFPVPMSSGSYFSVGGKGYHHHQTTSPNLQHLAE